jgi:hypothetical protein
MPGTTAGIMRRGAIINMAVMGQHTQTNDGLISKNTARRKSY